MEKISYLCCNHYTEITVGLKNGLTVMCPITVGSYLQPAVMYPHHCRFLIRTGSDEVWYKSQPRVEIIQISTPRQPFLAPRSSFSMPTPVHRPTSEHPSTTPRATVPSPMLLFFDADAHAPPHAEAPVHRP